MNWVVEPRETFPRPSAGIEQRPNSPWFLRSAIWHPSNFVKKIISRHWFGLEAQHNMEMLPHRRIWPGCITRGPVSRWIIPRRRSGYDLQPSEDSPEPNSTSAFSTSEERECRWIMSALTHGTWLRKTAARSRQP